MPALQLRRGTTAKVTAIVPKEGELLYDTQLRILRIGDGAVAGGQNIVQWVDWYLVLTTASTTVSPGVGTFSRAEVFVNGVSQIPGYNFSVANNVITFAETLPVGAIVYCKLYV